jgi:hypothetical protein
VVDFSGAGYPVEEILPPPKGLEFKPSFTLSDADLLSRLTLLFYFRHRAVLGDICIATLKRSCGYRVGLQHSPMETCDSTTGWETGEPEFPACAVVENVTRLVVGRNEMHSPASLTQNAHADWHG